MATKKKLTFEESLARLEDIVARMERGDIPLADSLKLFEEGTALLSTCAKQLDVAEQRVTLLRAGADGAPVETEFDAEERA